MKGAKRKPRRYEEPIQDVWKYYPGARSTIHYGYPAYSVTHKVFVFYPNPKDEVFRLSRRRVEELAVAGEGTVYDTERGMWQDWLTLHSYADNPDEHMLYFREAYWFALGRKVNAGFIPWVSGSYIQDMD